MNHKDDIMHALRPLFEEARAKNLWFYSPYQDMWFSPDDLEDKIRQGRFRWGPDNWRLRDPWEQIEMLNKQIENIRKRIFTISGEIADYELKKRGV